MTDGDVELLKSRLATAERLLVRAYDSCAITGALRREVGDFLDPDEPVTTVADVPKCYELSS